MMWVQGDWQGRGEVRRKKGVGRGPGVVNVCYSGTRGHFYASVCNTATFGSFMK